ncbi:hypothetical protein E2P81_ATG07516 [Venturia nashicola]|uniref:Uncharacterized protein n=1 Tax=Venturia nashicola TaxID=86259 RepID=A0A4Z1PCF5_9PEZI|nr:hypothetical protein E6O75_ATG07674 [Venturia nashicola]TLD32026.1 hypothetical protein E2P81_ATG07516 [Venturia nashicola]
MGSLISKLQRGDLWCLVPKPIRWFILRRERRKAAKKEDPFFEMVWRQRDEFRDQQKLRGAMPIDVDAEVLRYVSLHRRRIIPEDLDFANWLWPVGGKEEALPEGARPLRLTGDGPFLPLSPWG